MTTTTFPVPVGTEDTAVAIMTRGGRINEDGRTYGEQRAALGYKPHGDGGPDLRGSNKDRKIRKLKILGAMPIKRGPKVDFGGDGTHVMCKHCGEILTYATMHVDRIDPFGTYAITNVQPACSRCNMERGSDTDWTYNPEVHHWGPQYLAIRDALRGM